MMEISCIVKYARGLFLCMALIMALCSQAWADERTVRERGNAVVQDKGPNVISLARHEFKKMTQYTLDVPYNPMIFNENGRAIELKDLKVPCNVIIDYKWERGKDPVLMRLEVQKYEDNETTTNFTLPEKMKKSPQ